MRILMLTADYPPCSWSGLGKAVERQAEALCRAGVEVTVVVARPPDRARLAERRALPSATRGPRVVELRADRFPVDIRAFDLVHVHSLSLARLAVEIHRRLLRPLICTVHTLVEEELPSSPSRRFWSAVQDRLFDACTRLVFLSQAELEAATRRRPELAERAVVVPGGVADPPAEPPAPTRQGPPSLLFAGRFSRTKGLDVLAETVPRVLRHFPRGRCLLAGGHGDAVGRAAVGRLRRALPGRCAELGWLEPETLDRYYAGASLVLVPSRYEPFGLVALEAMRLGAPVLAADVGGLREVVTEGSGGRRVPGHDPRLWADAALALLTDADARQQLARRGPQHVRRFYGSRALARRLCEVAYAA